MPLPRPNWTDPPCPRDGHAPPLEIWRLRLARLGDDPDASLHPFTVPAEHRRARRYEHAADRHRHLAGRGLARLALSRRSDSAPRALSLDEGPHGKPQLRDGPPNRPPLHFNIAHTADLVVVAVSQAHPVGVDVEPQRRDANIEALAQRVLTDAERARWRAAPAAQRRALFLHLWTCKEAFLKATGRGLRRAPDTIECRIKDGTVTELTDAATHAPAPPDAAAGDWAVRPFAAGPQIAGAVVRQEVVPNSVGWHNGSPLLHRRPNV